MSVKGVGHLQILRCQGAWNLPTPSFLHAHGFLSTRRISLELYWKNNQIGSFVKDRKKLKRFVKAYVLDSMHAFLPLIKPELHSETRKLSTWINVFWGYWIKFLLILFEEHPFILIKLSIVTTTTMRFICMTIQTHTVLQKLCLGIKITTQGNWAQLELTDALCNTIFGMFLTVSNTLAISWL